MKITLAHGSGGKLTSDLINEIFAGAYGNSVLSEMEDSAVVKGSERLAFTTDSFVVEPLFFRGGDIGRLAVCGTVNDLLMRGAVPKYITSAFIIEEGADTELLSQIARSMAEAAKEAGVLIVAGDTKVIEGRGGVYINTSGIGFVKDGCISSSNAQKGDKIIVSGNLGDHHAAILSARMGIENTIKSDCAPLCEMVFRLMESGIEIHSMRDITRGGLGTVLCELADASGVRMELEEAAIPYDRQVQAFAGFLGLELLHMGNEGKLAAIVSEKDAERAVEIMKNSKYGENAAIIGTVTNGSGVAVKTEFGGVRRVSALRGEGLPRIC